jgi:hypothetical protein
MAVPEIRSIPVKNPPGETGTVREPILFPTQFQPVEAPVTPTLSPRALINRAFFPEIVTIRRERREVLRWEREVNLTNGRIRRQDEVLDSLDQQESALLKVRAQLLSTLAD